MDFCAPNVHWPKEAVKIFDELNKLTIDGKWKKLVRRYHKEQDFRRNFYKSSGDKYFSGAVFCNVEERIAKGVVTFQEWTEGGGKFVHGGAIATVLDVYSVELANEFAQKLQVTKSMKLEFKRPIPLFTPVIFEGEIDRVENGNIYLSGHLKNPSDDKIYDNFSGVFVPLKHKL